MFGKALLVVMIFGLLLPETLCAQSHFKRFPETVTNDGAYVLAWGIKDDTGGDVASKTEIPPKGPELGEIDSDAIEDYLVDTKIGKIIATIPDFTFFEGSEGRENHFSLEAGWSPDNHGGIAIYDSRYQTAAVAWINPAEHKVTDVYGQIEKAIRQHVIKKKSKKDSDEDEIEVSSPVFVRPRRLVLDAIVGALSSKSNPTSSSYQIVFNVKGDLNAPQLEFVTAKSMPEDSEGGVGDQEIEAELNKVYRKLARGLSPRDRENLKQEQLKWLETREHVGGDAEKDDKEFIQLRLTRRRVNELRTRALYQ
jgi:Lysozyme inhibitor LprI